MSAIEISKEERDLWRFEASDECGTPSEEDERILRLLNALETTEALLDGSVQETRANFSAVYQACTEIIPELKAKLEAAEAENARLLAELETAKQVAASAQAVAQEAWAEEIPSPLPGHKRASEDELLAQVEHLNCPLCGGSGHIGDCEGD